MIHEHHPRFKRFIIIFISYISVLQVLYALQTVLVSIPFVAVFTTFYVLILSRTVSSSNSLNTLLDYTGSNVKTNTTHEQDLQNLLVQRTEEVLQTNFQQFRLVSYFHINAFVDF
jgi:hypothetical protein